MLLAIPEICRDRITTLYHSSLFTGQREVIKQVLYTRPCAFVFIHQGMPHMSIGKKRQTTDKTTANNNIGKDLKVMPKSHKGPKIILCVIDKVTIYLITAPIYQSRSEEIGEALIENVISKYCVLDYIIMDLESALCQHS